MRAHYTTKVYIICAAVLYGSRLPGITGCKEQTELTPAAPLGALEFHGLYSPARLLIPALVRKKSKWD